MPTLPPLYVRNMSLLLGKDTDEFLRSYEQPRSYGLRFNPLKLPSAHPLVAKLTGLFGLRSVSWCGEGYTYDESTRPGRHVYHAAGLYYIQEPSAMIAAELLDPQPGDIVLDLAAAPGGKTAQIAAKMRGKGVLVANEIHPARAKILSENVERLGITNAIVTQASPKELSARFPASFDRILLDAPCSGEGMFRKDPDAMKEWSAEAVEACALRQRDILPHAAAMLKPGGTLVYSTCTFNTVENEDTVAVFLSRHPEFRLIREERMWPHLGPGEGHFAALLVKEGGASGADGRGAPAFSRSSKSRKGRLAPSGPEAPAMQAYEAFAQENLPEFRLPEGGRPLLFGEALFWFPNPPESPVPPEMLRGLKVPRPGLHLGDIRAGGRFEPNHALAMSVSANTARMTAGFAADSPEAAAYLHGETLPAAPGAKGWGLACSDGFPLGWFKASDGQYKNRLPKGLRSPNA